MGGLSLGRATLCCRRWAPVLSNIMGVVWQSSLVGNCFWLSSGKGNRQNELPECLRSQARWEGRRASFSLIWSWFPTVLTSAGWLDDIGLPQYKDQFHESRVDGRMLQYLTVVSTNLFPQFNQIWPQNKQNILQFSFECEQLKNFCKTEVVAVITPLCCLVHGICS